MKLEKIEFSLSGAIPIPVSATLKHKVTESLESEARLDFQNHFALVGELYRVADQVDQNLAQAKRIADQSFGHSGSQPRDQLRGPWYARRRQKVEMVLSIKSVRSNSLFSI